MYSVRVRNPILRHVFTLGISCPSRRLAFSAWASGALLATVACMILSPPARAQDPFEIHVYEYEQLPPGGFTLEAHLNFVGIGTKSFAGTVAPTNHQFHLTGELTGGIVSDVSLGFMLLSGVRPDGGIEYAGWRVLPHLYIPKSWHLPVDLGLVTEFSFQTTVYEANSRRVEIRPILEKKFGRFQVDLNPVFERALHGPGVHDGWGFEPAARFAYELNKRFSPSLEYYSSDGPFPDLLPVEQQVHQLFPGGDLKLTKRLEWSFGVGAGLTSASPRLVYKSRFEFSFGRKSEEAE
jgi:hypothetical protein